MMDEYFLSICIPTHNRASYLEKSLKNLFDQLTQLGDRYTKNVEICISDNGSVDDTRLIVQNFQRNQNIRIVYKVNPVNIGADSNFLKVVDISNGEYCWLLSDDDIAKEGSVKFLYDFLKENQNIDFALLSSDNLFEHEIYSDNSIKINSLERRIVPINSTLEGQSEIFSDLGFISVLCFRKESWKKVVGSDKFVGSGYIHNYILLNIIAHGGNCVHIKSPTLVNALKFHGSITDLSKLERIYIDVYWKDAILKTTYGNDDATYRKLSNFWLKRRLKTSFAIALTIRLNIRDRFFLILELSRIHHNKVYFYWRIYPFLFLPLGSAGKLLFLFDLNKVTRKFHR